MSFTRTVIIFLAVGIISQFLFYYPNLPEVIASHFDAEGTANGWSSKQSFAMLEGIILLMIILNFTLLPQLISRMPDFLINLPNQAYWLGSERRVDTFRTIGTFFDWFTIALLTLFIAINQLVFRANLTKQNISAVDIWIILWTFFVFAIVWLLFFLKRFRIRT